MSGYSAFGTLLGVATSRNVLDLTTRPSSWTYIGELTNIGGPSITVDTIDVSAHDSADAFREFTAGLIDGGDVSFEGNFIDADDGVEITDLAETREIISFCVRFPTTGTSTEMNYDTWLLTGALVNFETEAPFDGKIGFTGNVKVSGKPFLTSTYTTVV